MPADLTTHLEHRAPSLSALSKLETIGAFGLNFPFGGIGQMQIVAQRAGFTYLMSDFRGFGKQPGLGSHVLSSAEHCEAVAKSVEIHSWG